jgi:hypothetical protein
VLQSGLLRGHGGRYIAVGVVAWPRFVLWVLSLRGCSGCHCAVFCVAGAVIAWLWRASRHVAAVGVIALRFVSQVLSLRGHSGHGVAVIFVAWLQ